MVRYEYNPNLEGFKRVDNRGYTLQIDIVEARRIVALLNLGYKIPEIFQEMDLGRKISISTLRTFIRNYNDGNISIEGDFPVPQKNLDEMDTEVRFTKIEERLDKLEALQNSCDCDCAKEESKYDKVKKWFKK